ncbi:MAG: hypothetical protein KGL75_08015 [Acidobacteriota bacterium]|nr:hypothetical protein [Acidobacteriota bacterium]
MNKAWIKTMAVALAFVSVGFYAQRVYAHHSFAMYDQTKVLVLTGVAHQFIAQANHAELHFYVIGSDGKLERDKSGQLVDWGVEMAGAAAVAREGITGDSFKAGTIFTVHMNPLRSGGNFGSRVGPIYKCPWRTPPAAGKTCQSVEGMTVIGGNF